ncbi:alkaline phosphatase family protein [Haloarcula pellucida]|uniref:Alkaline phosphatase family protein n=1 Tax=Haloarcula pellucida TaxID=1427151 RepID=A0A830GHY7_9EURY|nr:nucleotide pyrophosphatase/phosphodiesterase family protein [Halomicroarcula pellucida]MBX0347277.1 alkaline phosphatase family protein [Halomicroarcula pellucida]GGN87874.1 alkaline phosphatase family protein [Halomicroarcula pellucida]
MTASTAAGRVIVLDVVGLQPSHLDAAPNISRLVGGPDAPSTARLRPPFPAVTVTSQTTLGTGLSPADHGDVANGRYDRERDTVTFWGRERGDRTRLWESASDAGATTGVLFFQHLVGTNADVAVTPSPIEDENNDMLEMNCWTNPDGFYDALEAEHGHFPLHRYWGPGANAESSEWILTAATEAVDRYDPDLLWVYLPHLDYDAQRHGPSSTELTAAVETVDEMVGSFLADLRATDRWAETAVAVLSEYGFHDVDSPVFPNRRLAREGHLTVGEDGDVDLSNSDAFAVVDHQVAHVYADQRIRTEVREELEALDGVDVVLGDAGKSARCIDHPDAGDFVLVADESAWFQYYWWEPDGRLPPYATDVDIHDKPGFDPCELFLGEDGMVSLDPTVVGGSHGRVDPETMGLFALGGPAAQTASVGDPVDARAVAPSLADLLGTSVDLPPRASGRSVFDDEREPSETG